MERSKLQKSFSKGKEEEESKPETPDARSYLNKKKALALDLNKVPVAYPPFPKAADRSSFLHLQQESSSLSKILSNKKETFCGLSEELAGDEPWLDLSHFY